MTIYCHYDRGHHYHSIQSAPHRPLTDFFFLARYSNPDPSSSDRSSQLNFSPRAAKAAASTHESSGTMPAAVRASTGASITAIAGARPESQMKSPSAQNGLYRRNSTSSHRRPSSAPGDNQNETRPPSTNGLDQRAQPTNRPSKPPLLRTRSDHPSRLLDNGADSSNDEQTIVAPAEDFGSRHGFDGHYQSEDIISQLANVGALFLLNL